MVTLEKVTKILKKKRALDSVSLKFPESAVSVVVGPANSGKTTLLRLLSGELKPDLGKIFVKKRWLVAYSDGNADLFYSFSFSDFTAVWSLMYPSFDGEKFKSLLLKGGIKWNSKISAMSQEMKNWFRDSLVFASGAEVMIFDEPLSHIEQALKSEFMDLLRESAENGRTVIVSTQDITEFETVAAHISVLNSGSLVVSAGVEELLSSHRLLPGATTISPDFKVIGPVVDERLVETEDEIGRKATLKEIVLGYVNGSS